MPLIINTAAEHYEERYTTVNSQTPVQHPIGEHYLRGYIVINPAGKNPAARNEMEEGCSARGMRRGLVTSSQQPISTAMDTGQGCGSSIHSAGQSRITLPDPGVLHLCKSSVILMRFCPSNNSSALSTGRGERKCGHLQGRCAGERVTLHGATRSRARGGRNKPGATRCSRNGANRELE